ncbi:hypothetical protein FSP39_002862 [Pinctada imbricata]|uniref:Uncharacterized protein n=1 Tax=Pinctada imbricata TaxID=66713 RepID=A0AA88XYK2_PINIB|nr:hypothetical protein FSP39_002862 [Pinctada imbricata]
MQNTLYSRFTMLLLIPFLSILSPLLISASSNDTAIGIGVDGVPKNVSSIVRAIMLATSLFSNIRSYSINKNQKLMYPQYYGKNDQEDDGPISSHETTYQEDVSTDSLNPKDWRWTKLQTGVEAGNAIVSAIGSDTHSTRFHTIGKIAKNFAPFLGAIGPALGFINMFIAKGPSPELQLMLREFARINAKFDQVFSKIDELETVIIEKAIKSQYGKYQSKISALSHLLNNFLNVSSNGASDGTRESRKNKFLEEYNKSDTTATLELWQGMMSQRVLRDYIPESVAKYTSNHRLQTQNILKRVLNSIIQGVNVMMYRYQMIGDNGTYIDQKSLWDERIQQLVSEMIKFDRKVADRYGKQSEKDTDVILANMFGASNKDVADVLYPFLSQKYDWRNWLVVVYDPLYGGDKHYVRFCGGFHRFRTHGRNTVVASISQYYSHLDEESVRKKILSTRTGRATTTHYWHRWNKQNKYICYDAQKMYDKISLRIGKGCNYPGFGVIKSNANIIYRAPKDHLVLVDKKCTYFETSRYKFKVHAFR